MQSELLPQQRGGGGREVCVCWGGGDITNFEVVLMISFSHAEGGGVHPFRAGTRKRTLPGGGGGAKTFRTRNIPIL